MLFTLPALALVGALYGVLIGTDPLAALAVAGLAGTVALAFLAPVAHLTLLLLIVTIVPFSLQNEFALGGGPGSPGLLASDVLLIAGLPRAGLALLVEPSERRRLLAVGAMVVFLGIVALQFVHGLQAGWDPSQSGVECRALGYLGTFLLATPLLANPAQRRRLLQGLVLVGLALGAWGIAQWVLDIPLGETADAGVRAGVRETTAGRGQVQGGLFAFPVAVILAVAALAGGAVRTWPGRLILLAVVTLNGVALLLTYERTFWLATAAALGLVVVRAGRARRLRALVGVVVGLAVTLGAVATLAPEAVTTAQERLLSLGQASRDSSVQDRLDESRHVLSEIRERPVVGSGLGATVFFWKKRARTPPRAYAFVHNGYLALAWKLGIPAALLFVALVGWAILARAPSAGDPRFAAVRGGCQAALLALCIVSVTFPSFTTLGITGGIGVLLAVCATPPGYAGNRWRPGSPTLS